MYAGAKDYIDPDTPEPLVPEIIIASAVDAAHANGRVTFRSTGSCQIFLGHALVDWDSKRIATVEAATYGAELIQA